VRGLTLHGSERTKVACGVVKVICRCRVFPKELGSQLSLCCPIVKLLDYAGREEFIWIDRESAALNTGQKNEMLTL
jgi:hypothetical protein